MLYDEYYEMVAYDLQNPDIWTAYTLYTLDKVKKVQLVQSCLHSGKGVLLIDPGVNLLKCIQSGQSRGLNSLELLDEIRQYSLLCVL